MAAQSVRMFLKNVTRVLMTISRLCQIVSRYYLCPLGSLVSLWNFETIRGSLMKPKLQKLASLAQEICTL